jgi:hypothetical protein
MVTSSISTYKHNIHWIIIAFHGILPFWWSYCCYHVYFNPFILYVSLAGLDWIKSTYTRAESFAQSQVGRARVDWWTQSKIKKQKIIKEVTLNNPNPIGWPISRIAAIYSLKIQERPAEGYSSGTCLLIKQILAKT